MTGFKSPALKAVTSIKPAEPRRVQPSGILHFTLSVTDLERSRRFYEDVVGCSYWRENETTVFMRCGEHYFVLSRSDHHVAPNTNGETLFHHAFLVQGADFDAAVAHLEASGVEVLLYEDKGHRSFTGRHLYFHDPDGNTIEFIDFQGIGDVTASAFQGRERRAKGTIRAEG
jgi:catechol 2,3-dioxygenase-like lactoylglutathione lyase family enzyme